MPGFGSIGGALAAGDGSTDGAVVAAGGSTDGVVGVAVDGSIGGDGYSLLPLRRLRCLRAGSAIGGGLRPLQAS
jgi:hypothetical protein